MRGLIPNRNFQAKPSGGGGGAHCFSQLKKRTEHDVQKAVVKWMAYTYPGILYTASAGGLHTSKSQAGKMKLAGYVKGCPDLLIFEPRGGHHGLAIELKRDGGKATIEQKQFLQRMNERGYVAMVCVEVQEAMDAVSKYMNQALI